MQFKLDENLPSEACEILRYAGHDAVSITDQNLVGRPDSTIAAVCKSEGRALVTLDTDFSSILAYPPEEYPGIVVIRTDNQAKTTILDIVHRIVAALGSTLLSGRLWIVEPGRIRVRGGTR